MCVFYWMSTTLHCVSRHHDLAMSESFKCSFPFKGSSFIVVLFELFYNVINWLEIVFLLFWVKLCRVKCWRNFIFIEQSVDTFLTKSQDVGQDYSEKMKKFEKLVSQIFQNPLWFQKLVQYDIGNIWYAQNDRANELENIILLTH